MRIRSIISIALVAATLAFVAATAHSMFADNAITGIGDEMLKQSYSLRKTYSDFIACAETVDCIRHNIRDIEKRRDIYVKRVWQDDVFARLMVFDNWAMDSVSRSQLGFFKRMLQEVGPERLRNDCVPQLDYSVTVWSGQKFFAPVVTFFCIHPPPGPDRG